MAGSKFKTIDTTSGAPKKVRAIVGNFDDPDRRLEAIKQLFIQTHQRVKKLFIIQKD